MIHFYLYLKDLIISLKDKVVHPSQMPEKHEEKLSANVVAFQSV